MSIIVEHGKRRREILEKALDVFMEEGYENVTFQKISDRCGITRTTLYLYFKNKKEIFNFSIKQFLQNVEADIVKIKKEKGLSHTKKLLKVMNVIILELEENRRLLSVVFKYLFGVSKNDYDPDTRVRRRTVRLRHILSTMLIEAVKAGELPESINVRDANELLYSFLESAVFRLVALRRENVNTLKEAIELAVYRLAAGETALNPISNKSKITLIGLTE